MCHWPGAHPELTTNQSEGSPSFPQWAPKEDPVQGRAKQRPTRAWACFAFLQPNRSHVGSAT
eukprot:3130220-Prymnesium_polylepis.1